MLNMRLEVMKVNFFLNLLKIAVRESFRILTLFYSLVYFQAKPVLHSILEMIIVAHI